MEQLARNSRQLGLSQVLGLPESGINSLDQSFLNKAIEVVNSNLSNEEFGTEKLWEELGMSRTQLHRKLQSLVGQSTSVFIRTLRLSHASELIKNKSGSISEIAFEVGFNNLSYFAKCFQEHFGVLPSEYPSR